MYPRGTVRRDPKPEGNGASRAYSSFKVAALCLARPSARYSSPISAPPDEEEGKESIF